MIIAVSYDNGEIFQHFGQSQQFKLYEVEDEQVLRTQLVDVTGGGHGAIAGMLAGKWVDVLICGGIGPGAQETLAQLGIRLCAGVDGRADDAVQAFLDGDLVWDPNVKCDYHGHEHHHGQRGGCHEHGCHDHGCDCH